MNLPGMPGIISQDQHALVVKYRAIEGLECGKAIGQLGLGCEGANDYLKGLFGIQRSSAGAA